MKLSKIKLSLFALVFTLMTSSMAMAAGAGFNDGLNAVKANTGNIGLSQEENLANSIIKFLEWAMYLIAFVAVAAFVVSGFMFIFSAGEERAESARKILTYAIIGLVVALLGWVILKTVADVFTT